MHIPSEGGREEKIWGEDEKKESEGADKRKESEGGTRGRNLRGGWEEGNERLIQEHMKYPIFQTIFAFGFSNGKVKEGHNLGCKWERYGCK